MRTPLNGIVGVADLLHTTQLNSEQQELMRLLRHSVVLLRSLVDDVLDISKIEAGRLQIEITQFDLYATLNSIVKMMLPDANRASVILCLNSSVAFVDEQRRAMLVDSFGSMFTFGYYFHEVFMRKVVDAGMPSALEGAPLTTRERECLTLAANGLTTEDVAARLGIKPRTAQFHFDSIRTKLAVATRHEAIAHAVHQRLIRVRGRSDVR